MLATSVYTILLIAGSALGCGHHRAVQATCDGCGVDTERVMAEVMRLQAAPRGRDREDAAEELRRIDWRCHPEVVEVLASALLTDCDEEVREEAAESLAKLAPCVPTAHAALRRAANSDPDHATRHWARKGLKRLARRCDGDCDICGPAPGVVTVTEPALTPQELPPPPIEVAPPIESPPQEEMLPALPPVPEELSPFVDPPAEPALDAPIQEGRQPSRKDRPSRLGARLRIPRLISNLKR